VRNKPKIYKYNEIFIKMETISEKYQARFIEGVKSTSSKGVYKTQKEWERKGLLNFKRRVLGLFGRQSVKSLDELAGVLTEMSVVDSAEEGKDFIKELYGKKVDYGNGTLEFTRVQDRKEQEACRIKRYGCALFFNFL